ncbi:MAG: thioredoxin family protein [Candidatus Gracilibacteria bacterium]|nr:thioredoxin family protein [Candidatus Gracilibacteria bacterium]
MIIKVLGGGCPNCKILEENVKMALKELDKQAEIQKVTNMEDIMMYDIMGTPALVIDEKVVSSGKINSPDEIIDFIKS